MTNATESFYSKIHRLLAEGKLLYNGGNRVVGAYKASEVNETLLVILRPAADGLKLEFEKSHRFEVCDGELKPY